MYEPEDAIDRCIPSTWICNQTKNCADGSDEVGCRMSFDSFPQIILPMQLYYTSPSSNATSHGLVLSIVLIFEVLFNNNHVLTYLNIYVYFHIFCSTCTQINQTRYSMRLK